jgi:hypothetical protein
MIRFMYLVIQLLRRNLDLPIWLKEGKRALLAPAHTASPPAI